MRLQLGTMVGQMIRTWTDLENDAISQEAGINPDPMPQIIEGMEAAGWTYAQVEQELLRRGISARYIYFSGLGMVIDCARLQAHRHKEHA